MGYTTAWIQEDDTVSCRECNQPGGVQYREVAFINHGEALRDRKTQERIAKIIVDAINSAEDIQPPAEPN